MISPHGELMLRRYGKGGAEGESAVKVEPDAEQDAPRANVTVRVEGGPRETPPPAEETP